jgi:Kef-type K+ transport system membrane component KefB
MTILQIASALIELGAGLALLCCPSAAATLLIGAPLDGPAALTVARVCGAGLFALGVACWLARGDTQSRAARGLIAAMLFYDVAVAAVLAFAAIGLGLHGVALWPAVVLHGVMSVWCVACLRPGSVPTPTESHLLK